MTLQDERRPPLACGEHLARCLRTAPVSVAAELAVFARRVVADEVGTDLGEIMSAVCLDAIAAVFEHDELLADLAEIDGDV